MFIPRDITLYDKCKYVQKYWADYPLNYLMTNPVTTHKMYQKALQKNRDEAIAITLKQIDHKRKTMATGINLVVVEPYWNPELEEEEED